MKKLNRIQKNKLIEGVKTAMLVLLFSSCLFSGYRIFDIYHKQTTSNNNWWGSYSPVTTGAYDDLSSNKEQNIFETIWSPELIMICDGDKRGAVPNGSDEFKSISVATNTVLHNVFYIAEEEKIQQTDDAEWKSAVKGNSVYLRYPAERFTTYDEMLYGTAGSRLSKIINSYDELVIAFDEKNQNTVTVFVLDKESDTAAKAVVASEAAKELFEAFEEYKTDGKSYVFAYELNLDSKNSDKPGFNSMMVVPTESIETGEIVIDIPKTYKAGLNFTKATDFMAELINIFGYNPNTIRQYVNSDDALIFVGETGSLSIDPEGRIEYKALGTNDGILLSDLGNTDVYGINSGICEIMTKVFRICGINVDNCDFEVKISQTVNPTVQSKKHEIWYDYFVDGKKIEFSKNPAVYAAVENGVLTEIKMQIKDIEKLNTQTEASGMFEAIDEFCAARKDITAINDAKLIYKYTENGEKIRAEWSIQGD
jgi:hypothetical protein